MHVRWYRGMFSTVNDEIVYAEITARLSRLRLCEQKFLRRLERARDQAHFLSTAAQFSTRVSAVLAFGWGWPSKMRWPSRVMSMNPVLASDFPHSSTCAVPTLRLPPWVRTGTETK